MNSDAPNARKRAISDDDESSTNKKTKPKSRRAGTKPKQPKQKDTSPSMSKQDFKNTIDKAVSEDRIDEKKAARLNECIQEGDWSEIAYNLLCEQIPMKRKGKGYFCRVCEVPKKGHACPYCPVCSTPESKHKKTDEHVCFNCPTCFEMGKKKKKLWQVQCEGHDCPYEPHKEKSSSSKKNFAAV